MLLAVSYGSPFNTTVVWFLTLLTVLAQVFVVATWILRLGPRSRFDALAQQIGPIAVPVAFGVSAVAMAGSLFFQYGIGWRPCNLCWFQRACLYPTAIILGVATVLRRRDVAPYALALSIVCVPIAIYHYLVEYFPQLESSVCDLTNPCSVLYFRTLGYISIPLMAATAALTVITLMALLFRARSLESSSDQEN